MSHGCDQLQDIELSKFCLSFALCASLCQGIESAMLDYLQSTLIYSAAYPDVYVMYFLQWRSHRKNYMLQNWSMLEGSQRTQANAVGGECGLLTGMIFSSLLYCSLSNPLTSLICR